MTLKDIIDRLLIPVQTKGWIGDQYRVAKFTVELIAPTVAKLMAEAVKDAKGGCPQNRPRSL